MAATPLTASTRFFQPEISKYIFLPACADTSAPTRVEIDAGTDLSDEIADISGWMVESNQIDTPDMGTRFVAQIGGRTSSPQSSITFYGSQDGTDVRDTLPRDTTGFMLIADGGDVPTQPCDVFPVKVSVLGKVRSTGDQAFQITITFTITSEPAEDSPLPAAS